MGTLDVPSERSPVTASDDETAEVARRAVKPEVRKRRRKKREKLDWASVYEGLRWVLFARR